jgi:hypothetical protein
MGVKRVTWRPSLKTSLIIVVAVLIVATIALVGAQIFNSNPRPYEKPPVTDYVLPIKALPPNGTTTKVDLEKAVEMVKNIWDVPSQEPSAKILQDTIEGRVYWSLAWASNGRVVVTSLVDADTGEVVFVRDFRYTAKADNIGDMKDVVALAKEVLKRLGIREEFLSEPFVRRYRGHQDELHEDILYDVEWGQLYKGLPVLGGYVAVTINPELKRPVGFVVKLVDVREVDVNPHISKDEAIKIAEEFLRSRGYRPLKVTDVNLAIGRPNYYWEGTPKLMGAPTLLWVMKFEVAMGSLTTQANVQVDAHSGEVVGGDLYR